MESSAQHVTDPGRNPIGDSAPYFHARVNGPAIVVRGLRESFFGHRVSCAHDEGLFGQWSWNGTRLSVSTDRYGLFPLYYYERKGEFAISPSIPTLIELGAPTELDEAALAVFLRTSSFVGDDTAFKHIRTVPAAKKFEWTRAGLVIDEHRPQAKPSHPSREAAVDSYICLFSQAMQRRLPQEPEFVVPLSGGQDSRHIVLELCRQKVPPSQCVTGEGHPSTSASDVPLARQITASLGLAHVLIKQQAASLSTELEKNALTSFTSTEHGWYMGVRNYVRSHTRLTYDGLAGDILSAGALMTSELLACFRKGVLHDVADMLLNFYLQEDSLKNILPQEAYRRFTRESAAMRLEHELKYHCSMPNPISSYYFWNRCRRLIAPGNSILLGVPTVFCPYLDRDLFDFLISLPAEMTIDGTFHKDAIFAAYPRYRRIPFSARSGLPCCTKREFRVLAGQLFHFLYCGGKRHLRASYVLPRLARALIQTTSVRHTFWLVPFAIFWTQLLRLAEGTRGSEDGSRYIDNFLLRSGPGTEVRQYPYPANEADERSL